MKKFLPGVTNKRILITGGLGFIGSAITWRVLLKLACWIL